MSSYLSVAARDDAMDFREVLKHREQEKKQIEEEETDWPDLKPLSKRSIRLVRHRPKSLVSSLDQIVYLCMRSRVEACV